jgi:large conductance mechanosensitive channel
MLKGFREFILRGNVIDLAVAVVIGAAFAGVVDALVKGFITPLIGALVGQPSFDFTIGPFGVGLLLTAVVNFLLVAAAIYFVVVMPMNRITARFKSAPPEPQTTRTCPECLSDIPRGARRCAFCTAEVAPATGAPAAERAARPR